MIPPIKATAKIIPTPGIFHITPMLASIKSDKRKVIIDTIIALIMLFTSTDSN